MQYHHLYNVVLSEAPCSRPPTARSHFVKCGCGCFVRYLKLSIPSKRLEIERRFTEALESMRARAAELNITPEDIAAEIRAVREANARRR